MNTIKFENGWCGGKFFIGDEYFNTNKKPKANLIIDGKKYTAVYKEKRGVDNDHGHSYSWKLMHIGILDGILEKRFLSVAELKNHEVMIELLE